MHNTAATLIYQVTGYLISCLEIVYHNTHAIIAFCYPVKKDNRYTIIKQYIEMIKIIGIICQGDKKSVNPAAEKSGHT